MRNWGEAYKAQKQGVALPQRQAACFGGLCGAVPKEPRPSKKTDCSCSLFFGSRRPAAAGPAKVQAPSKGKRLHYQSQERDRQDRTQGGGKRDLRGKDGVAVILVRQNRARAAGGHPRHQDADIGQRRVQVERFEAVRTAEAGTGPAAGRCTTEQALRTWSGWGRPPGLSR